MTRKHKPPKTTTVLLRPHDLEAIAVIQAKGWARNTTAAIAFALKYTSDAVSDKSDAA